MSFADKISLYSRLQEYKSRRTEKSWQCSYFGAIVAKTGKWHCTASKCWGRHAHGPYGLSVVAVVVVIRVAFVRIEVEFPRVVRVAGVERRRPVVAVGTSIVELVIVAVAGGRQENTTRLRRRYCCFRGQRNALCKPTPPSMLSHTFALWADRL